MDNNMLILDGLFLVNGSASAATLWLAHILDPFLMI